MWTDDPYLYRLYSEYTAFVPRRVSTKSNCCGGASLQRSPKPARRRTPHSHAFTAMAKAAAPTPILTAESTASAEDMSENPFDAFVKQVDTFLGLTTFFDQLVEEENRPKPGNPDGAGDSSQSKAKAEKKSSLLLRAGLGLARLTVRRRSSSEVA